MEDPSWRRNCDLLEKALQSLERGTSQIRRSTNKLITLRDIAKEREKVKQVTSKMNTKDVHAIQDALSLIEKFMRLHPTELQSQGIKLTNEAQAALENYQRSCDAFYKKCIGVEESLRTSSLTTRVQVRGTAMANEDDEDGADENTDLLRGGEFTQKDKFERDLHDEIMAERQRETSEIAENVKDINEIFTHIHSMVNEQGVTLDTVEGNLNTANRAARNGANSLRQAQQYRESSSRDRMLLICLVTLAFVVSIVVLLS